MVTSSRQPENPGPTPRNRHARALFAPLASNYERWSRWLSLGQDPRWRRTMVDGIDLTSGSLVADVAAGTGAVSRLLLARGFRVIAVDQSPEMLAQAAGSGIDVVCARAEELPFDDASLDGLTFTYLLRYVDDPRACLRELARVLRPGGMIGMVEFGVPRGIWRPPWIAYTRLALPAAGMLISPGWRRAGSFLGPSIEDFHRRYPGDALIELWLEAGFTDVRRQARSLGGGVIMWGRRQ
jgi:demethylmenaquinone methyltransferase/2-methoxy-6-polyprenyl-1,4-benzoquinol methylase